MAKSRFGLNLDWESRTSAFICPRVMTNQEHNFFEQIQKTAPFLPGHLWLQSSGSSTSLQNSSKWIALCKKSFLISAAAVNQHFQIEKKDRWGIALPLFHVGALSILARASLTQSPFFYFSPRWNSSAFCEWISGNRISCVSLVPTQIFDLVHAGLSAPRGLRLVIVGGGFLDSHLFARALSLGWPLSLSFGMTETCSMIAASEVGSRDLQVLSHAEVRLGSESEVLEVRSGSLMTGFAQVREGVPAWLVARTSDGFWTSPDRAELHVEQKKTYIFPKGRIQDYIKINGEGLDLSQLRLEFDEWLGRQAPQLERAPHAVIDVPHLRRGRELVLVFERPLRISEMDVINNWNQTCAGLKRLRFEFVETIPRSSLGKILWTQLREQLKYRDDGSQPG